MKTEKEILSRYEAVEAYMKKCNAQKHLYPETTKLEYQVLKWVLDKAKM